ncbi:exosortase system-associated protein, TIGR04073 family [Geotalea sp. SG265]|uniref:exosortase system-associated protein, TIGR04073 family n=1 Tax=Geotalea sp. SG265 TaxID=2922867 RepID=UPI001FAFDC9A|nr:exosortase system-associated protein, TIGR04073 family [Geotalea sp. SG265]
MPQRGSFLIAATVLIWLLAVTAPPAGADDYRTVENAGPQEVVDAMASKAARGLANTATGWGEFPKQIYLTAKDDGIAKGLLVGPLKGVGMTLVRTASGLLETVTFFIPYPGFYDPYFDPAYVWQKE